MAESVKELMKTWTRRTFEIFQSNQQKLQIGQSMDLYHSLKHKTRKTKADEIIGSFGFLERGRFSDMGVGKGTKFSQAGKSNRDSYSKGGRKPKKWYSRAFFGRLNALQGAIGFTFMERSISAIKDPLTLQSYQTKRNREF